MREKKSECVFVCRHWIVGTQLNSVLTAFKSSKMSAKTGESDIPPVASTVHWSLYPLKSRITVLNDEGGCGVVWVMLEAVRVMACCCCCSF